MAAETTIDHLCWSKGVGGRECPARWRFAFCKTPRPPADLGSRSVLKVLTCGGAGEPRSRPPCAQKDLWFRGLGGPARRRRQGPRFAWEADTLPAELLPLGSKGSYSRSRERRGRGLAEASTAAHSARLADPLWGLRLTKQRARLDSCTSRSGHEQAGHGKNGSSWPKTCETASLPRSVFCH